MSEEERKAIKGLEWSQRQMRLGNLPNYDQGHYADISIALNLIKKQQKEIEKLNKSDESKEQSSMKYYNLYRELVDKIKAKIEEVEQWELYNMKIPRLSTLDERLGAKIGIKYVLQSLLEKRWKE